MLTSQAAGQWGRIRGARRAEAMPLGGNATPSHPSQGKHKIGRYGVLSSVTVDPSVQCGGCSPTCSRTVPPLTTFYRFFINNSNASLSDWDSSNSS